MDSDHGAFDEWVNRATAAANALSDAERQAILSRIDASISGPWSWEKPTNWRIVDELGVTPGFASRREAENDLIIGTGMFDNV